MGVGCSHGREVAISNSHTDPEVSQGIFVEAGDPRIAISGRFLPAGSVVRMDWPGTRIMVTLVAPSGGNLIFLLSGVGGMSVRIDTSAPHATEGTVKQSMLWITGARQQPYRVSIPSTQDAATLTVTLSKTTEATEGELQFGGVRLQGSVTLKQARAQQSRRAIEFIGDSDAVGFGVHSHMTGTALLVVAWHYS